jgi:hypothetical protein
MHCGVQVSDISQVVVSAYTYGFIVHAVVADASTINGLTDKTMQDNEGEPWFTHPMDSRIKVTLHRDAEVRRCKEAHNRNLSTVALHTACTCDNSAAPAEVQQKPAAVGYQRPIRGRIPTNRRGIHSGRRQHSAANRDRGPLAGDGRIHTAVGDGGFE